jgi:hypothetical protein
VRTHAPTSTHKKVVVVLLDGTALKGYLNPVGLGQTTQIALLTPSGEHNSIHLEEVKGVYFVREFRDEDVLEGIVGNNLLDLLDAGVQITPPDLHGNTLRIFVPRSALTEMKVLGVVGVARRTPQGRRAIDPKIAAAQSKLFRE